MVYSNYERIGGDTMASIKYVIELSESEKEQLKAIVSKGSASAQTILRANILLASDRKTRSI